MGDKFYGLANGELGTKDWGNEHRKTISSLSIGENLIPTQEVSNGVKNR